MSVFRPASFAFAAYWATPILVRDHDVLTRCGRIQAMAAEQGSDTPAGWYAQAARSYLEHDDVGRLAKRACLLVSADLAEQVPS